MVYWRLATLLCALAALSCGIALWWLRERLANRNREIKELEGSARILAEERHVLQLIAKGATLKQVLQALTQGNHNVYE